MSLHLKATAGRALHGALRRITENYSILKRIEIKGTDIKKILFLGKTNRFAVVSNNGQDKAYNALSVIDITNGKKIYEYEYPIYGPYFSVSQDGDLIALCKLTGNFNYYVKSNSTEGYEEYKLNKYNTETGNLDEIFIKSNNWSYDMRNKTNGKDYGGNYESFEPITYSPDKNYYAIANIHKKQGVLGIYEICFFKTTDNSFIKSIETEYLSSFEFSPDGNYIFGIISKELSDNINEIPVYSFETGKRIKILKGHEKQVYQICVYPNSKYLASASKDETIRIWDIESGKTIKVLKGHTNDVNCVAFSKNGKYLVSGSDDGTIRLLDVSNLNEDFNSYIKEYELNIGLENNINKEKEAEIKLLDEKFKAKGEFETTEAYNTRISEANIGKKAIEEKYLQKLKELKQQKESEITGFINQVQDEKQKKIEESIKDTVLHIDKIGNYDADKETFPITIAFKTAYVNVPFADAVEFKKNYTKALVRAKKKFNYNLTGWEYYDIVVINPNNNAEYIFK